MHLGRTWNSTIKLLRFAIALANSGAEENQQHANKAYQHNGCLRAPHDCSAAVWNSRIGIRVSRKCATDNETIFTLQRLLFAFSGTECVCFLPDRRHIPLSSPDAHHHDMIHFMEIELI